MPKAKLTDKEKAKELERILRSVRADAHVFAQKIDRQIMELMFQRLGLHVRPAFPSINPITEAVERLALAVGLNLPAINIKVELALAA